ncbi:hypothetical protein J4731_00895 [Providencia rettgeri]|nr:hypothetical protein [Providencia rettgeri]
MNLLKTRRWGADVDFQQTLGNFTFQESYSWLRGRSDYNNHGRQFLEENGKNTIDYTKSGLTKVPEHSVKLKVKYDLPMIYRETFSIPIMVRTIISFLMPIKKKMA